MWFDSIKKIYLIIKIVPFKVGWIRKDTRAVLAVSTFAISLDPRINVSESDGQTWNLHISNVEEADNGVYSCQINTRPEAIEVSF